MFRDQFLRDERENKVIEENTVFTFCFVPFSEDILVSSLYNMCTVRLNHKSKE